MAKDSLPVTLYKNKKLRWEFCIKKISVILPPVNNAIRISSIIWFNVVLPVVEANKYQEPVYFL